VWLLVVLDVFGSHVVRDLDVLLRFSTTFAAQSVLIDEHPIFTVLLIALLTIGIETRSEPLVHTDGENGVDGSAVRIVRVAVDAEMEYGRVLIYNGGLGGMVSDLEQVSRVRTSIG
jgi:hypothetical protein